MTDTSKDAVDRMVLAMIRIGNTTAANMLTALLAERDAANARADQARDAALVEALSACKQVAETAREYNIPQMVMGANKCHDDISDLRIQAHAILAIRDKPAPGMQEGV